MTSFIGLFWSSTTPGLEGRLDTFGRELCAETVWQHQASGDGWQIFSLSERPVDVRPLGGGASLVIGDLFEANGQSAGRTVEQGDFDSPERAADQLLQRFWGRYVAVWRTPHGAVAGVLRDPCGADDTLIWSQAGVTIVATDLPDPLVRRFGPGLGLDWDALHGLLADPLFGSLNAPLKGMATIPPGAFVQFSPAGPRVSQRWRPVSFALDCTNEARTAEAELRRRVDLCVAAFAGQPGRILMEVSGGFDSSVVAGTLSKLGAPVAGWCNHYTQDPSGDERAYARAVGQQLGIDLIERPRAAFVLGPDLIARSQFGPRPSAFALDGRYDTDTIEVAQDCGATRLFTGFGGDGLFWLSPLAPIARDLFERRGWSGLLSSDFGELARWCRKSVWSLALGALRRRHATLKLVEPAWVRPLDLAKAGLRHPWLADVDRLPPAKGRHVEEQVLVQLAKGVSLRGKALDLVHPLLSQPVLEYCLSVPVDVLVSGGRDRALARRAFQDRLPSAVIDRRSKGELGLYYSRAIAAGLPRLREYLLEGRLLQQGLLIRPALERVLDDSYLAQHGGFSILLCTVAIEAWTRHWEGRARGAPI